MFEDNRILDTGEIFPIMDSIPLKRSSIFIQHTVPYQYRVNRIL